MFYMAYVREEKRWAATPVLQGMFSVGFIVDLYLFVTAILIEVIFKVPIFSLSMDDIFPFIIFVQTIVIIIIYFIYGYKKRYTAIIEKYKGEDEKTRKKNRLIVNLFIIFSVILLVVISIVGINQ